MGFCSDWEKRIGDATLSQWMMAVGAGAAVGAAMALAHLVGQARMRSARTRRRMAPDAAGVAVPAETLAARPELAEWKLPEDEAVRTYAVIGGAGSLGAEIVTQLAARSGGRARVVVVDVAPPPDAVLHLPNVEFRRASVVAAGDLERALHGAETVFLCAAMIAAYSMRMGFQHGRPHAINVDGARNTVEACRAVGAAVLVYTSTVNVLSNVDEAQWNLAEDHPYSTRPLSIYGSTKLAAEKIVLESNGGALATVAMRPPGLYGPRDTNLLQRVIETRQVMTMCDFEANVQDFASVENAALAHLLAAVRVREDPARVAGQSFHFSDGSPISFGTFNRTRSKLFDAKMIVPGPLGAMYMAAAVIEWLLFFTRGRFPGAPVCNLTPPAIRMATCSYYYNVQKAHEVLGYSPMHHTLEKFAEIAKRFPKQSGGGAMND